MAEAAEALGPIDILVNNAAVNVAAAATLTSILCSSDMSSSQTILDSSATSSS